MTNLRYSSFLKLSRFCLDPTHSSGHPWLVNVSKIVFVTDSDKYPGHAYVVNCNRDSTHLVMSYEEVFPQLPSNFISFTCIDKEGTSQTPVHINRDYITDAFNPAVNDSHNLLVTHLSTPDDGEFRVAHTLEEVYSLLVPKVH